MANKTIEIMPSTIETIDRATFTWLNERLNVFCTTNDGWRKVPVSWVISERAHKAKADKDLRDDSGALVLPMISLERETVAKDPARKGTFWAHVPPNSDYRKGSIVIGRKINQEKTTNFANAHQLDKHNQTNFPQRDSLGRLIPNEKVVYQTMHWPMPVYVDVTYGISVMTQYQQQMNEIVTPFITKTGGINFVTVNQDGHRFEAFIQSDFAQEDNVNSMSAEERTYKTKISVKVLGYLIGEGKNQETPKIVIRENAVEVKMPRERVVLGDIPEHTGKDGFYRE
jgi:hypothetical protein